MLSIEGLCAGYASISALQGVSIRVAAGQFVAIVGPNGAGKTTLFKAISGIVTPSAGAITFEGTDLLAVPPSRSAPDHFLHCINRDFEGGICGIPCR